ncbi:MAG TPA: hypothetical protein VNU71_20495 [Burkholderiaceae bacterium]|nr:hypothetical protein [Burkholderiaceae bacterium]
MTTAQTSSNPFALMMEPEAVFAALARSDRLSRLSSRICRPLDKPMPVPGANAGKVQAAADQETEGADRHDD